jgi:hypothetical protein
MGTAKPSHGKEDQPADLHPGDLATRILTKEAAEGRHLGLETATAAMTTAMATGIATAMAVVVVVAAVAVVTTTMGTTTMSRLPREEQPLGISSLNTEPRNTRLLEWVGIPTTLRTAHTVLHQEWAPLLVSLKWAAPVSRLLQV